MNLEADSGGDLLKRADELFNYMKTEHFDLCLSKPRILAIISDISVHNYITMTYVLFFRLVLQI